MTRGIVGSERPESRGDFEFLAGVLILAGVVRALAWSRTAVLFNDGPIFLAMAEALAAGRVESVFAHPQHPLYPACIALVSALGVAPETAAIAVSIAGGLLAVAALHALGTRVFGRVVGRGSALVMALHPTAVDFSSDVLSDGLYLGLFLSAIAQGVALFEAPGRARAIGFGLLAGLAYWTRPEALGLVVIAGLLALVRGLRAHEGRQREERAAFARVAMVGIACALVLVGVLRASEWSAGDPLWLSQKKSVEVLARGGPSPAELSEDRRARRAARDLPDALPLPEGSLRADGSGLEHPPRTLVGMASAVLRVGQTGLAAYRYELLFFTLLGLARASAAFTGRMRGPGPSSPAHRSFDAWLALVTGLYGGLLVLLVWGAGYVSRRHALPIALVFVPYAVVGWFACVDGLRKIWERRWGRGRARGSERREAGRSCPAALLVLALVLLVGWGPRDLRERRLDRAAERDAARWLAERGARGADSVAGGPGTARADGVAAQKLRTAYYAGAPFVPLPDGRDGLIRDQIRRRGARWVVIDAAKLGDHVGLAAGIGDWLMPVHEVRSGRQRVLVLELVPSPAD